MLAAPGRAPLAAPGAGRRPGASGQGLDRAGGRARTRGRIGGPIGDGWIDARGGKEPLALSTVASDAILALLNLGYEAAQAETAVMAAAKEAGNDLKYLLRFALKRLAPK